MSWFRRPQERVPSGLGIDVFPNQSDRTPTVPPTTNFRPTPIQSTPISSTTNNERCLGTPTLQSTPSVNHGTGTHNFQTTPTVDRGFGPPNFQLTLIQSTPIPSTPSVECGLGLGIARQRSVRLPVLRPSATSTPLIPLTGPGLDEHPEVLLNDLLNETLRNQAEAFVRKTSGSAGRVPRDPMSRAHAPPGTATPIPPQDLQVRKVQSNNAAEQSRKQRSHTITGTDSSSIPQSDSDPFVHGPNNAHYRSHSSSLSPPPNTSHSSFSKLISRFPTPPSIKKIGSRLRLLPSEFFPYFSTKERQEVEKKVYAWTHGCEKHENCTDCTNEAFAFFENIIMSTAIPAEERQKIISNNKSLRTIKNVSWEV